MRKVNERTIDSGQEDRDLSESSSGWGDSRTEREELEARLQFETLIADLSSEFVDVPSADLDRLIGDVQRRICQCLDIGLSGLWQWLGESPAFLRLTHLYRTDEGPPTPEPMDAGEYFPWCLRQLLAGQVIAVPSVEAMPPEAARDREVFRHFGIQSTFVEALGRRMGKKITSIPRKTIHHLQGYSWPGNVRELSNLVERAMILTTGDTLDVDLPAVAPDATSSRMTLEECQRAYVLRVLDETGWRIRGPNGAAEILAIKPTTLETRMAKLGIKRLK
jgi:hypothetical protein